MEVPAAFSRGAIVVALEMVEPTEPVVVQAAMYFVVTIVAKVVVVVERVVAEVVEGVVERVVVKRSLVMTFHL